VNRRKFAGPAPRRTRLQASEAENARLRLENEKLRLENEKLRSALSGAGWAAQNAAAEKERRAYSDWERMNS
jgi:regulator of replication initiation timing